MILSKSQRHQQISQAIDFAVQGVQELPKQKTIEDYYKLRASWINTGAEKIEALFEQELTEARIDELQRKMTLNIELLSSKDFKAAFNEALDQIDAVNDKRIAELRHQTNKSKPGEFATIKPGEEKES